MAEAYIDVTDATFEQEVLVRSAQVPVVVDLWAPWCGPCKTLGPILERVVAATAGSVVLAKVDVDQNPQIAQSFRVQGIPAVFAIVEGQIVDSFTGAQPEAAVTEFVTKLLPTQAETEVEALVRAGDEASLLAALEIESDNADAVVALAELMVNDGRTDEALALLERIPENAEARRVKALARTGEVDDVEEKLAGLLDHVKGDEDKRQEFVDLLELMGPQDPRTAEWRKKLTARLF